MIAHAWPDDLDSLSVIQTFFACSVKRKHYALTRRMPRDMLCYESCRVVSCRVVSCRVVSCRVVSCRVVSCRVVSCRVVSCRVVSCMDLCVFVYRQ